MAMIGGTREIKTYRGDYDFGVDGGAISTITLRSNSGPLPNGAIVLGGYIDVTTLFTTGSAATAALQVQAANDLQTATIVSGAPYSTTGIKAIVPVFTAATMIKLTAERSPAIVIATGTITAGVLGLILLYV